ncbi:hypothetical protein AB0H12_08740 [Actinosynnema sp. NPDC023794]
MRATEIIAELNELRRGRGLQVDDLHAVELPNLRRACGVAEGDRPAVVREKLVLRLTEACGCLPGHLQTAALAALALHEEAHHRFLHERMAWFRAQIDRDSLRTARRWVDSAFKRLADELDSVENESNPRSSEPGPNGWYTESLLSVLDMEADPPELTETRTIVATADELDEIVLMVSAPKGIHLTDEERVTADMKFGGRIVEAEHDPSGHSQFVVRLPKPLSLGERHSYSVRFKSYRRMWMRPYYVLLPLRHVEHFKMHLKFPAGGPERAWKLSGVPPVVLESGRPNDHRVQFDESGEAQLEFFGLRAGLAYGIGWSLEAK